MQGCFPVSYALNFRKSKINVKGNILPNSLNKKGNRSKPHPMEIKKIAHTWSETMYEMVK
jgi:hypothetical protein